MSLIYAENKTIFILYQF